MASVPSLVHAGAQLEAALQMVAAKQIDDAASALFALLAEVEKDCETYSVDGSPPKELLHFKARVVGNLGNALYRQGPKMMEQALEHFCEARSLFTEVGDGAREGSICYSTANALDRLGMHVEAVDMMQEFIRLGEEHGAPEKRLATARAWIAKRTGSNTAASTSNPFGDDTKPASGARVSKTAAKVRLTPMQALEAAAEAADTPLTALLGTGTTMATPMLEFGFENLQFADVLGRSSKSLRMLDSVCGMLRARASAEERYAESLVNARAEEQGGVVGEVTAGLWSAFGSMVGAGSAALGIDDPLDPLSGGHPAAGATTGSGAVAASARSLGAAVEAVAEGAVIGDDIDGLGSSTSTRQRRTESHGQAQGLGAGAAGARRWDNGTIAAAVTSIERHALSEAARRRRLAVAWQQGVSQLSGIKVHHASLHKEASSRAEVLVRSVTAARRKLLRGHERLRKAHSGEAEAKASLHRATEAVSKLMARYSGSPTPPSGDASNVSEQGARAVRDANGEAARRAKQLERAVLETGQAEEAVQAAVVEHLTTRRVRDGQLAELARRLQAAEEARLEALAGALRLAGTRWHTVQNASAEAGGRLARAVERVDPGSDIRQFIHQRRVVRRVKEQAVELRRWEANRAEAERRRARREAAAKAKTAELEAVAGLEAAAHAAKVQEGAEVDADGVTIELAAPTTASDASLPESGETGTDDSSAPTGDMTPAHGSASASASGAGAGAGGWLRRFTRRGRAGTGASGDSVGDGIHSPVVGAAGSGHGAGSADEGEEGSTVAMEALEGLRDEDDDGACVVPVSVSRERASTFTSDSMKAEAELSPVARAWVVRLFAGAAHGVTDAEANLARSRAAGEDVAAAVVDEDSFALPVSGPAGGDYLAATDEEAREAILRGDDDAIATRLFAQPSGRALFLSELNWWRAHGRRLRNGLARLGRALRLCLDACKDKDDVAAAKLLMIMSQTFYSVRGLDTFEDDAGATSESRPVGTPAGIPAGTPAVSSDEGAGTKRFASDWLRGHALWLDAAFWEEALYRSVREESERPFAPFLRGGESGVFTERLVLTSSRAAKGREKAAEMKQVADSDEADTAASTAASSPAPPSPSGPVGASGGAGTDGGGERLSAPPFLPGSTEWAYAYRQALFGQLGSYAMNMLAFGMPEEEATRVVSRLARGNGLPAEMLQALLVSMDPSSSIHRQAERQARRKNAAKAEESDSVAAEDCQISTETTPDDDDDTPVTVADTASAAAAGTKEEKVVDEQVEVEAESGDGKQEQQQQGDEDEEDDDDAMYDDD